MKGVTPVVTRPVGAQERLSRAIGWVSALFPDKVMTNDEAREARIQELTRRLKQAMADKDRDESHRLQAEWKAALLARSPAQIARMEQERRDRHA